MIRTPTDVPSPFSVAADWQSSGAATLITPAGDKEYWASKPGHRRADRNDTCEHFVHSNGGDCDRRRMSPQLTSSCLYYHAPCLVHRCRFSPTMFALLRCVEARFTTTCDAGRVHAHTVMVDRPRWSTERRRSRHKRRMPRSRRLADNPYCPVVVPVMVSRSSVGRNSRDASTVPRIAAME